MMALGCLFLVWLVFAGLILRHILRIHRNIHQMRRAQCRTGSHVDRRFRP